VVLAGFATRTSRLTLGTDILVAAFHNPVRLAEDAAVLDVMSSGRFTLGIAIGYKPDEFSLYGVELENGGRGSRNSLRSSRVSGPRSGSASRARTTPSTDASSPNP